MEGQAPQKVAGLAQHCLDPVQAAEKSCPPGVVYLLRNLYAVDALKGITANAVTAQLSG